MRQILFALITFYPWALAAQDIVDLPGGRKKLSTKRCEIFIKEIPDPLKTIVENKLTDRGYKVVYPTKAKRIYDGDYYLEIKQERLSHKFLYKDCKISHFIKRARVRDGRGSDPVIHQSIVTRGFPRITFEGGERCRRAARDTFIGYPYCQ